MKNNIDNLYKIQRYFFKSYPHRSTLSNLFFRKGEDERVNTLIGILPELGGLNFLEAGCGDGRFLKKLLRQKPSLLKLEDIIPQNIELAKELLKDNAETVSSEVIDSLFSSDPCRYNVILAIGLTDYYRDWDLLIRQLLKRCRGSLFIDFPKSDSIHSLARRVWLRSYGIFLHTTSRKQLIALINEIKVDWELHELALSWLVKINQTDITSNK